MYHDMIGLVIIVVCIVLTFVVVDLRRFRLWWEDVNMLYSNADSVDDLLDLRSYIVSSCCRVIRYRWQRRLVKEMVDRIDSGLLLLSKSLFLFLFLIGGSVGAQGGGRLRSTSEEDDYSLVQGKYHTVSYRVRGVGEEERVVRGNKERGLGFLCVTSKKFMVTNEERRTGFEIDITYIRYDGEYSLTIMGKTWLDGEQCWLSGTVSPVSATIELRSKGRVEVIRFYAILLNFDKEACRRAHKLYNKNM